MNCARCGKDLYARNKTGLCSPCWMRTRNITPEQIARTQAGRAAKLLAQTPESRLARFQIKRGDDECWEWAGAHNGVGYGVMRIHKRVRLATHIALEAAGRPRPSDKHSACHSCDNPPCTNPRHLWWGTHQENMQDAVRKGRLSRDGERGTWLRECGAPITGEFSA